MTDKNKNMWTPARIAILYAIVGGLWILSSDQLVGLFFGNNPAFMTKISIYKGWGYVAVTAWLLYIVIKLFRTELENEAIRKSSELLELNTELRKTNEDLEFFAHATYHDLREPLRQLSLYIEYLEKKLELNDPDTITSFNYIKQGAARLDSLLNDIRNYTAIRKNKFPSQIISLMQCAENAISILKPEIEKKQAIVTVKALPEVSGSLQLYTDVFKNLIENALKYNTNTPAINIYAQGADIYVADNGIGIAPEYREKVFLMFERLHTAAEYSGTGVGLAICKKIVELYGGKISIKPGVNSGSIIIFSVNLS